MQIYSYSFAMYITHLSSVSARVEAVEEDLLCVAGVFPEIGHGVRMISVEPGNTIIKR